MDAHVIGIEASVTRHTVLTWGGAAIQLEDGSVFNPYTRSQVSRSRFNELASEGYVSVLQTKILLLNYNPDTDGGVVALVWSRDRAHHIVGHIPYAMLLGMSSYEERNGEDFICAAFSYAAFRTWAKERSKEAVLEIAARFDADVQLAAMLDPEAEQPETAQRSLA